MASFTQILGFSGAMLVIAAYLAPVRHLMKVRCSMGINFTSFWLWLIASCLLLVRAVVINSGIFIFSQVINITLIGVILIYAYKCKECSCSVHKHKV